MKLERNFKMILLFLAVVLFSCEPNAVETDSPEEQLEPSSLVFNRKSASEMTQLLKKQGLSFLVDGSNESGKSKPLYLGDVLETIDSLENINYSFNFNIDNQKENEFFNLVVNKSVNGIDAEPFVLKFISDESTLNEFETSSFDFLSFTGKIERYTLNSFLGSSSFSGKSGEPCDCVDVDNGDTGSGSGGGGGSSGPGGLNPVESCEWTSQTTHTIPDGRTFEFGPGSTCQHPGECEVVSFLVLKCQGQQSNKFSGCGSGCEDVNGPVAINLISLNNDRIAEINNRIGLTDVQQSFLRSNKLLLTQLYRVFKEDESIKGEEYIRVFINAVKNNNFEAVYTLPIFVQDPYDVWGTLSQEEKELIKNFPFEAYAIFKNRTVAEVATVSKFNRNGLNDKSDAFRHAYFNALNARKVGKFYAKLFSDAHESNTPVAWLKEKEMDLFNNNVGHSFATGFSNISHADLVNKVYVKVTDGSLRYLTPINLKDPNFIQTHGITTNTKLTPTNK